MTERQTDKFDSASLDVLNEPQNQKKDEDYESFIDTEDERDGEHDDDRRSKMSDAFERFNIGGKQKFILAIGLITVVGVLLVFSPLSEKLGIDSLLGSGRVGDIISGEPKATEEEGEGESTEESTEQDLINQLIEENPGYDVVPLQEYFLVEGDLNGVWHQMIYSQELDIIAEYVDEVLEFGEDLLATLISVEGETTLIEGTTGKANTQPVTTAEKPAVKPNEYTVPEDKVLVNKADYEKSSLKLAMQQRTDTFDEYDRPVIEEERIKLIVQYELLPLRGSVPTAYAIVIETGEELIFNISMDEYIELPQKGTTVLQVNKMTVHGMVGYDEITITNWQN